MKKNLGIRINMNNPIKLLPENAKPFFKSDEEYEAWRQSYIDEVAPQMKKWEEARRKNLQDAMFRIVN